MYNGDNRKKFLRFMPLLMLMGALFFGLIVMLLWNAILPTAIHAGELNYWQATGLLVLSRILFGGWGGGDLAALAGAVPFRAGKNG